MVLGYESNSRFNAGLNSQGQQHYIKIQQGKFGGSLCYGYLGDNMIWMESDRQSGSVRKEKHW